MNSLKTVLLSASIATSAVLGIQYLFPALSPGNKSIRIEHLSGTPTSKAVYTLNDKGELKPLDFVSVSEKVIPAVVHIKSTQLTASKSLPQGHPFMDEDMMEQFFGPQFRQGSPQPQVGTGSGVIISENGYIVTNNHVIEGASDIEVSLHDNRVFKARLVGTDPTTDLAVLEIKADNLQPIAYTNSDEVKIGEWVMAVGNPFSLNSTVTAGIVSAKGRNINILREQYAIENFIQTDAAINPGNSGGALVDLNGALVGINTAIASPTGSYSGYGFAVPSNIVNKVVNDLIEYGMVQRAVLGISIRNVDGNLAKEKGLTTNKGVFVEGMMEKSAAAKSGIKEGDVIIAINEKEINNVPELQGSIAQYRPGDKVSVTYLRGKETKKTEVMLTSREGRAELSQKEEQTLLGSLGAEFMDVEKSMAEKLKINGGVQVKKLGTGKLSRESQLREGFIITHVDKQEVRNTKELEKALNGKTGGVLLEGVYPDIPGRYFYGLGLE